MVVGESRLELLHWLNVLLQLDYVKVEQCGTGAAFCQLMDSIYGGVPLGKVNFSQNLSEYDALNNMKVLQASFNKNGINKNIQVERLIKCRLQDNLELLQWFRHHWLDHQNVEMEYDAVSRRKGVVSSSTSTSGSVSNSRRTTLGGSSSTSQSRGTYGGLRGPSASSTPASGTMTKRRVVSALLPTSQHSSSSQRTSTKLSDLEQQLIQKNDEIDRLMKDVETCQVAAESLKTERNFYFNKLRELEILTKNIQVQYSRDDAVAQQVKDMSVLDVVEQVQEILYMTEKGFEVQENDAASF